MKKNFLKAVAAITLIGILTMGIGLSGCGKIDPDAITVVTRERGSGTRDAFVELSGVMDKKDNGDITDRTTREAITIDGTQAVMSNVVGNKNAIGYISLGSLNDTVKAARIEGIAVSAANIKNKSYPLARSFYIATKQTVNGTTQDFINFILSREGQAIVESTGYVSIQENAPGQNSTLPGEKVVVAGSSSVAPVMEKLKEAYLEINQNATIEIQTMDSSSGVRALQDGNCDIAMASRSLKDSETGTGENALIATPIAMDGITVILHKENDKDDLTVEQIKGIFMGEIVSWKSLEK